MRSSQSKILKNSFFYIIALPQPPFSSIVCRVLIYAVASSYQVFFVLGGPGVEFSSDQVSPKKEIPTEPKPKSSAAGWGLQGLDTVKEMLMWCRARAQTRQLVPDLVDIPPSHGRRVRMVHHHSRHPTFPANSRSTFNPHS